MRVSDSTTDGDIAQFLEGKVSPLILLEHSWKERIERVALFVYEFDSTGFRLLDEAAGYWISETNQKPLRKFMLTNPLERLSQLGMRVCFRNELLSLREEISNSSLRFSMIRLRNA